MVDLRYVFNLLSVLNERSHSADVIGNVHKMRIKVWMLGKNSQSKFQVPKFIKKIYKIQNMMYHCSQLATAIRGEQLIKYYYTSNSYH